MDRGEIEAHLKTLPKCDEDNILHEMERRGFQATMLYWPRDFEIASSPAEWQLNVTDDATTDLIRFAVVHLVISLALQDGVNFDDVDQFVKFLAKCAARPATKSD